jgi:hypothetical protein
LCGVPTRHDQEPQHDIERYLRRIVLAIVALALSATFMAEATVVAAAAVFPSSPR